MENRSHEILSHPPRKWDIIIILVTSSVSIATTYYPIYLLFQFHSPTIAVVQKAKKGLLSVLCNSIFVSFCYYRTQNFVDFVSKVNLTKGFHDSMSKVSFVLYFIIIRYFLS